MSRQEKTNGHPRRGLAYHFGVFAFGLGQQEAENGQSDREREAKRQHAETQRQADRLRAAQQQGRLLRGLEDQLGVFAFLLGPKALRDAVKEHQVKREREAGLRPREEKQREYARQQEAERRRQQEREAERRRRHEEQQRDAESEQQRRRDQAAKRQSEKNDWWSVLEVSVDASNDEIHRSYLRKIRQYHPDRVSGLGPEFVELAETRTKALNAAYEQAKRKRSPGVR